MSLPLWRRQSIVGEGTGSASAGAAVDTTATRRRTDDRPAPPRSDYGTILLHWVLAIAIVTSLVTGLRLSADAEHSVIAKSLEIILPQGEIWSVHFISALVVVSGIFAYAFYMSMGRLRRRVSLRKTVVLTLPASPKLRWGAVNVILYWILFSTVLGLAATGILLYLGYGGIVVDIHYVCALVVGSYIIVHVFSHYMYGGLQQLLRLFRPQALRSFPGMAPRPLATALFVAVVVAAGFTYADLGTRDVLVMAEAREAPVLDGVLSDAAWDDAAAVPVRTQQGSNLSGSGTSTVELRAVRHGDDAYFAFRWEDATRSLKRLPLIKREDGWHMLNNRADIADETDYYEDKLAILISRSDAFGNGGTTHMGPKPLDDKPGALNGRGLHYTTDGSLADVWQWKASRGGLLGRVDDMWFGSPVEPNEGQIAGTARYSAGYAADEGKAFYVYNYVGQPPGGFRGPVQVVRLPLDHQATTARLGEIDLSPGSTDDEGSQWWMFESETAPYSAELDSTIPVGTVIPGVLIMGEYSGSRADITGEAKWADGYWTLELTRKMKTGHKQDLDLESGLFIWLSVFDHDQTRHTRHVRPVRLEIE